MPRDLFAERDRAIAELPELEKIEKPQAADHRDLTFDFTTSTERTASKETKERDMGKADVWSEIKPYTKSLTPSDVPSCVKLEDATFPPQERATREKVSDRKHFLSCGQGRVHV